VGTRVCRLGAGWNLHRKLTERENERAEEEEG